MQKPQNRDPQVFRRRWLLLCVLGWSTWPGLSLARPASVETSTTSLDQFVRQLESSYRSVKTLRAQFTQTWTWGGRTRVESGRVYFARGGLMRWHYQKPKEKLFLSDGKKLLLYIPDENQLTRSSVKSSEDVRVPFRLLLSRPNLHRVFSKIEFADLALRHQPENYVLRAFPKLGYEEDYREVLMELTPAFDIRKLVVFYPDNSHMEFTFDHIERNVALDPGLFRFIPPANAEVIEQP